MKKYIIFFLIALVAWIIVLHTQLEKQTKEVSRLKGNQISLLTDASYYRTKDSLSVASVQRLNLTLNEYETYFADQSETIKSLELKLKRVQSATRTATETTTPIQIQLRDSVVVRDSLVFLKCMELHTPYLDLSGCIEDNAFTGHIINRDTLDHIVHRIPKKFLFFRWGTKAVRLEVVSSNPYTQLTYARYIELK